MNNIVTIENTNFIFKKNFSGDPEVDNYGSTDRKANIIIPSEAQARELMEMGFNVKCLEATEPGKSDQYHVVIKANYDSKWPPKIYLVAGDAEPVLLDEQTVGKIDSVYVLNVNVILNPYYSERNKKWGLYIKTMYVECDEEADPFASRYRRGHRVAMNEDREPIPFN